MKIISTFLFLIILLISCKNETENKIETWHKKFEKNRNILKVDTLYKLLDKSKTQDTLEFSNQEPFLFIKTGKLFSKIEKNAIIVNCPNDTTYKIELYTETDGKWKKNDEINNLEVPYRQYEVLTMDYNFDGFIDIYLNSNSSQGWSLSNGSLLTVDTIKRKFVKHKETANLKNMFPDKNTKTISTDSVEYNPKGKRIWNLIYKWENGKLIKTKKKIQVKEYY